MRQIFISHSAQDAPHARRLIDELSTLCPGDQIYYSSDRLLGPAGGTRWETWIRRVVTNCDIVVALVSDHASSSAWCNAELGMARLLEKPILPLTIGHPAGRSPLLSEPQADLLERPTTDISQQIDTLIGRRSQSRGGLGPDGIPYPGLEPLSEEQGGLLFGRAADRDRILRDFSQTGRARLVILSGPSGSGKSSLARAGLIPELRALGWSIAGPVQPGDGIERIRSVVPAARPALVLVDQAEQLAFLEQGTRTTVAREITRQVNSGTWVLMVVRSEFRDEAGLDLPKPIDHYLPFLGRDDLRDVIRGPAKVANLRIRQELVDRLVNETGSGEALPLLALTLRELWKNRDVGGNELLEATLNGLGGVQGVMERLAEEALHTATDGDPAQVPRVLAVLTRLASPNSQPPVRSPVRLATFTGSERFWLDEFAEVGLVTYRTAFALSDAVQPGVPPTGDDLADVTHEKILQWKPLAAAITTERDRNLLRDSIERAAREWDELERNDDTLFLAGDRLAFALAEGMASGASPLGAFVAASARGDHARRLRRWLMIGTAVSLAVAVFAALFAGVQERNASRQRDTALAAQAAEQQAKVVASALQMAAESTAAVPDNRDLALLTAVAAYRTAPGTPAAEGALIAALTSPTGPVRYFQDDRAKWNTLHLLDERHGLVADWEGRLSTVDLEDRSLLPVGRGSALDDVRVSEVFRVPHTALVAFRGQRPSGGDVVGTYDFNADQASLVDVGHPTVLAASDRLLVTGAFDGGLYTIDRTTEGLAAPHRIDTLVGPDGPEQVTGIDLSPDGRLLVAATGTALRLYVLEASGWSGPALLHQVPATAPALEHVVFRRDQPAGVPVQVCAAGGDPTIRCWRIAADGQVGPAEVLGQYTATVRSLAVDPDRGVLYTAGVQGRIQRWSLDGKLEIGAPLVGNSHDVTSLSVLGNAPPTELLVSTWENGAILWDQAPSRTIERADAIPESWRGLFVTTLIGGPGPLAVVTKSGRVLVDDGRDLPAPDDVKRGWWAGDTLIFETRSNGVWVLDGDTLRSVADAPDAVNVSGCVVAVADGRTIRLSGPPRCQTGQRAVELAGPPEQGAVTELAFSADGHQVAVGYEGGRIDAIEVASGATVNVVQSSQRERITALAWVGSSSLLVGHAIGAQTEHIDLSIGQTMLIPYQQDNVLWLASRPSGDRVYLAGEDGSISEVSLGPVTGLVAKYSANAARRENDDTAEVVALQLSADASVLYSIQGSRLTAWEKDPSRLVTMACERAGRMLSASELQQLGLSADVSVC